MKSFTPGQLVQVQRQPAAKWEPATYLRPHEDWPGSHLVDLPDGAERCIDRMLGGDCDPNHPRACKVKVLMVPARRIRNPT